MENKKGQLSIGNAPTVVLIVGLTFLVMATIAFIGQKYGEAMPSDTSIRVDNETLTTVTYTDGEYLNASGECNVENLAVINISSAKNGSEVTPDNFTVSSGGLVKATLLACWNNSNWNVTYTYDRAGIGCNVNRELEANLSDNTSIAGIVLTISLVGIVLTVLIGVFLGIRKVGSRI